MGALLETAINHLYLGHVQLNHLNKLKLLLKNLHAKGEKFIRGGAFKPRTSPYDFQGLGVEGLKILKQIKDKYDLNVVSEIVNQMILKWLMSI